MGSSPNSLEGPDYEGAPSPARPKYPARSTQSGAGRILRPTLRVGLVVRPLRVALAVLVAWAGFCRADQPRVLFRQHFESRYGVEWAGGRLVGGEFVPGRRGRGLAVDRETSVTFPTHPSCVEDDFLPAPNLDLRQGTVEFWHQPDYAPDDGLRHVLFAAAGPLDLDALVLEVNAAGELLAHRSWGGRAVYITTAARVSWKPGEWLHVALTWDAPNGVAGAPRVYLRGRQVKPGAPEFGSFPVPKPQGVDLGLPLPAVLEAPDFCLCHLAGNYQATGLLDEAVIYDRPLTTFEVTGPAAADYAANPAPLPPPEGLLLHCRYDVGAAADVAQGQAEPLGVQEPLLAEPGRRGGALRLDDQVSLLYASGGNFDKRAGTLALWVCPSEYTINGEAPGKPTKSLGGRWFLYEPGAGWNTDSTSLYITGGRLRFRRADLGEISAPVTWRPGEWHHLAATWEEKPGRLALYHDGALVAEQMFAVARPGYQALSFWVGGTDHPEQSCHALGDDLCLYNRPLTAAELKTLYERLP